MPDVNKLIHDWEDNLVHAREVCAEAGPESEECEAVWETVKELDIHFEQTAETSPSEPEKT